LHGNIQILNTWFARLKNWFNFKAFEEEVRRVSKPGGVIGIWGYNLMTTTDDHINAAINNFYANVVGPYWDDERKYLEQNYETVPFGFPLLSYQTFSIETRWSLEDLTGYLNSWSAVQHFITANEYNPVNGFEEEISTILKNDEYMNISFPVFLKIGRVE
jgi:hypothetical protein